VLINTQWITRLRWVAVVGQLGTILVTRWGFGIPLPLLWLLTILTVTASTNVALHVWARAQWLSVPGPQALPRGNAILLAVMLWDLLALTALLYLTGGTTNPFCVFYLVNFALAAVVLSEYWTWTVVTIGLVGLALITFWYQPIDELQDSAARHIESAAGGGEGGPSGIALSAAPVPNRVTLLQAGAAVGVGLCGVVVVYFVCRLNEALQHSEARRRIAENQRARSERLEALGTLAAGAGHELSTPLSTIAVVSKELGRELADRDDVPDSVRDDVHLIRDEVERCRNILNRLSLDSGRSAGEPLVEATVAQLVDEVLSDLRAPDRIAVGVQSEVSHRTVFVPLVGLAQALRGLVQNALDAASQEPVYLRASLEPGELHVQIEDQGPGMTPDVQSRAFDPFFTTKAPGSGMGLGMFLAQSIIQRLGGRVELESTVGQGTLVRIWLPLA
jgi:two-component system sensor histidine kinase RegB